MTGERDGRRHSDQKTKFTMRLKKSLHAVDCMCVCVCVSLAVVCGGCTL